MSDQKILSYTVYSKDSADFLTLALAIDSEYNLFILGFLVDAEFFSEEVIQNIQDYLQFLGGKPSALFFEDRDQIFAYSFDNKEDALRWFAERSERNPSRFHLASTVNNSHEYLNLFSSKKYAELLTLVTPKETYFQGRKKSTLRRKDIQTDTLLLPLSSRDVVAVHSNSVVEIFPFGSDSIITNLYDDSEPIEEKSKYIRGLKMLDMKPDELDCHFVVATRKGDIFIFHTKDTYYPDVSKITTGSKIIAIEIVMNNTAVAMDDNTIGVWDCTSLKRLALLEQGGLITHLTKFSESEILVIVYQMGVYTLKKWDLTSRQLQFDKEIGKISIVSILVLNGRIILANIEGEVKVIEGEDTFIMEMDDLSNLRKIVAVPHLDGILLLRRDSNLRLVILPDKVINFENTNSYTISAWSFLPNKQLILGAKTGEIELFDMPTGKLLVKLQSMPNLNIRSDLDKITSIVVLDKDRVMSASAQGEIILWQ